MMVLERMKTNRIAIRKSFVLGLCLLLTPFAFAAIDMQAHVASDEGKDAYTDYTSKQTAYYTGSWSFDVLYNLQGDALFGELNALMGQTCRIASSGFSYNSLRDNYVKVDRDLNASGKIIGYYDGQQMDGEWGSGYNREHTWPQSKGAKKGIPMGHDMQSVRPTSTSVNSERGNTAYGEGSSYYDPDDVEINNSAYKSENMGTYRGDAARVILYDYIVYGEAGGHKSSLYNGNAQLLSKLGGKGVFESLRVLLKWHMQDPPSLTEMVRNDGAQDYQGNRNPFIDYPELAIQMLRNNSNLTTYEVSYRIKETASPRYQYTLTDGFVTYLTAANGTHPEQVSVTGGQAQYDATLGRLIVKNITGNLAITTDTATSTEIIATDAAITIYTIMGVKVCETTEGELHNALQQLGVGTYILRKGNNSRKVVR